MPGLFPIWRWARGITSVCFALVLCLGSLAPLAARALDATGTMACCRTKRQCCCRKSHSADTSPSISARSCGSNCSQAPGVHALVAGILPRRAAGLRLAIGTHAPSATSADIQAVNESARYSRPPPAL